MGLPEFSIRKPITTIMIFAGVMLFGVISLMKLPQELFPPITYPQLTVFTGYANAAPEEIETLLTKPIEEAVGTVSGLKTIRSISKEGISLVMAEFDWDQNMDFASLRMREKLDLIKARLPRDATEPLVVPFNPFELPIMTISVTGSRSPVQLRQIAVDTIKEELEKIDGVASASVEGGLEREILVEVDQGKLASYNISILDVASSITNSNLNYPAGTIKESFYEYLIRTIGEFKDVNEIEDVVVKNMREERGGLPFEDKLSEREISPPPKLAMVRNIAKVKNTFKERSSFSRYNADENVSISIQKQAQTNTTQVINKIRAAFGRIEKMLPEDVEIEVIYDQSIFIRDAINGVRNAALQGGVLAFLVLLIFLRSFRASLIVTLSIPISVMIVFTFMYFGKLSINMMSLGGLALGVGMLVDNAIVVIENIFRHREQGKAPKIAAADGAEEVSTAIVASTLTTIAVFLPMIFVVGVAGQLFKELAFTVTFSLVGSLWVALTLIPLLSCRISGISVGKNVKPGGSLSVTTSGAWRGMLGKYEFFLRKFLKYKFIGLLFVLVIFIGSLFIFTFLEKELMPKTDQGQFIVKVDMPVGTKLSETNKIVLGIEDEIHRCASVDSVSSVVGSTKGESAKDVVKRLSSHEGQIIVNLKEEDKIETMDFIRELKVKLDSNKDFRNAKIEFSLEQGVISGAFGTGGKEVTIEIKGDRLLEMEIIMAEIEGGLKKIPGIFGIENDAPEEAPEVKIHVNKDKAALHGISVVDLARIAQMVLRGSVTSQFKEKGHEIDIRVRLRERDRDNYDKLYRIRLNSPAEGVVSLGSLARFDKGEGPSEIKRLGQERTIMVTAGIVDRKKTEVISDVDAMLKDMKLKSGYTAKLTGESEEMKKSFNSLKFALILSLVMVYMIMAAQFESLTQPLIILFTVPLSLIGVLVALYSTNTSVNVVALLGVIMLGGIVVNNGIVLIDYTNILMKNGRSMLDSVVEASLARLRPIIMTALTTVLGLFPMALALGRGSELRAPMAISVMGGLIVSTFLTLVVIPSIFLIEGEIRIGIKSIFTKIRSGS